MQRCLPVSPNPVSPNPRVRVRGLGLGLGLADSAKWDSAKRDSAKLDIIQPNNHGHQTPPRGVAR